MLPNMHQRVDMENNNIFAQGSLIMVILRGSQAIVAILVIQGLFSKWWFLTLVMNLIA